MGADLKSRQQRRKRLRYRLVYPALSLLPYAPAYDLVSRLDNLMFEEMQDARGAYEEQLRKFLPELQVAPERLPELIARQSRLRSRGELDAIWPYRWGRRSPGEAFSFSDQEFVRDLKNSGDGVIIVMTHFGRPVPMCHVLAELGIGHGMLTQTFDPKLIDLDREEMLFRTRGMKNLLGVIGGPWFTLQKHMQPLYTALRSGQWVIIMCDLFEPEPKSRLAVPFLGGEFLAPNGIPRLARKTGARLVYGVGREDQAGRVHVGVKPLPGDPEAGVVAAFAELEQDLREYPWQWHHWAVMREAWRPLSAPASPDLR